MAATDDALEALVLAHGGEVPLGPADLSAIARGLIFELSIMTRLVAVLMETTEKLAARLAALEARM